MKPLNAFRAVVLGLSLSVAAVAHADVHPSDIANAVKAHNLPQAESLARQATQEHPNSAKAWYLLAQVEERLHKPSDGLDALQRATTIDPSKHFAKSPDFVDQLQTQLNQEQGAGTRSVAPMATVPSHSVTTLGSTSAAPMAPSAPASHGHFPWGMVLLVLVLIGAGIAAVVILGRRKQSQQQENERQDAQRVMSDAQTRAMELQKTIRFEGKATSTLANDTADIIAAINTELTHLKSTSGNAWVGRDAQRDQALRALTDAERRQRAGQYDSIAPAARSATERIADADAARARADQQRRDDQIRQQQAAQGNGYNPGYQGGYQGPAPVIINNGNSNDGLLTGVLLGEALSDRHDRVVERDVYIDRGRDRSDDWDDNRRRANPPADDGNSNSGLFDTGSGNDNSWDDNSSGVDSGSSNDSFDS